MRRAVPSLASVAAAAATRRKAVRITCLSARELFRIRPF